MTSKTACSSNIYRINSSQMPISCPMPGMPVWNAHPKVYIPLSKDNPEQLCPYCSAKFILNKDN